MSSALFCCIKYLLTESSPIFNVDDSLYVLLWHCKVNQQNHFSLKTHCTHLSHMLVHCMYQVYENKINKHYDKHDKNIYTKIKLSGIQGPLNHVPCSSVLIDCRRNQNFNELYNLTNRTKKHNRLIGVTYNGN